MFQKTGKGDTRILDILDVSSDDDEDKTKKEDSRKGHCRRGKKHCDCDRHGEDCHK